MTADMGFVFPPAASTPATTTTTTTTITTVVKEPSSEPSSMQSASSVESLAPPPHLKSPEKTWPSRSAGPHYPVIPLSQPLLRIVPGDPRFALPAVEWVSEPLPGPLLLQATLSDGDSSTATVVLPPTEPNPIPDHWFDFFVAQSNSHITFTLTAGHKICETFILVSEFSARKGVLRRPLVDETKLPIACLTIDFLYASVHPLGDNGFKVPFIPRFTGHRGMGSSGPNAPWRVLENSLESFAMAALLGSAVKTIELDVQVTRDDKLVIFHDWFFRPLGASGHPIYDATSVKIPIFNLTFDELDKLYRQSFSGHNIPVEDPSHRRVGFRDWASQTYDVPEEAFDVRLRTLRQTCEVLPTEVGMLVELKYPPPDLHNGRIPYPEKNHYVDLVLEELMTVDQNKDRKIAFLTFDADLCVLLSLKQTKFPVYLSHCEILDKPCDEFDPRTIDIREGLKFARSQRLDGLMMFNEIVEQKPDVIAEIVSKQVPIITYGDRNCDESFVEEQFRMGVSGIIADDIDALTQALSALSTSRSPCAN